MGPKPSVSTLLLLVQGHGESIECARWGRGRGGGGAPFTLRCGAGKLAQALAKEVAPLACELRARGLRPSSQLSEQMQEFRADQQRRARDEARAAGVRQRRSSVSWSSHRGRGSLAQPQSTLKQTVLSMRRGPRPQRAPVWGAVAVAAVLFYLQETAHRSLRILTPLFTGGRMPALNSLNVCPLLLPRRAAATIPRRTR